MRGNNAVQYNTSGGSHAQYLPCALVALVHGCTLLLPQGISPLLTLPILLIVITIHFRNISDFPLVTKQGQVWRLLCMSKSR